MPGPTPSLFFAPDQIVKRNADWGPGGFDTRLGEAWDAFVIDADGWLDVVHHEGPDAVLAAYLGLLDARSSPATATIALPG